LAEPEIISIDVLLILSVPMFTQPESAVTNIASAANTANTLVMDTHESDLPEFKHLRVLFECAHIAPFLSC
jgi:predicted TIM-barrel enzyme